MKSARQVQNMIYRKASNLSQARCKLSARDMEEIYSFLNFQIVHGEVIPLKNSPLYTYGVYPPGIGIRPHGRYEAQLDTIITYFKRAAPFMGLTVSFSTSVHQPNRINLKSKEVAKIFSGAGGGP